MPSVLDSLNSALHQALAEDPTVVLLGEDLLDPYGGAFRVTRGLSTAYPGRVITTPISEAGIVGVAAGMALRGLRPVVEIMFGDFLPLAADQLINHAAKFRWMYNEQVQVPMVIRTPMGGRRGYGPTHSQTLEKHFLGVPGLTVLAPSALSDPCHLLKQAILSGQGPVLFIENKLLYPLPVAAAAQLLDLDFHSYPGGASLTLRGAPPASLTMTAYGFMAELARQALVRLAYEHELFSELVVVEQLSPFDLGAVVDSAARTRRLITIEEGSLTMGWGAEVCTRVAQALDGSLFTRRVAAQDLPIPAAGSLEAQVLPGVEDIISAALQLAGRK